MDDTTVLVQKHKAYNAKCTYEQMYATWHQMSPTYQQYLNPYTLCLVAWLVATTFPSRLGRRYTTLYSASEHISHHVCLRQVSPLDRHGLGSWMWSMDLSQVIGASTRR